MQMLNLLLASGATAFVVTPPPLSPSRAAAFCPRIPAGPYACAADAIYPSPTAEQSAGSRTAIPTPALQPREVIGYVLTALHKSNFDTPRARFGCEVALRFLAPSNPASKSTPQGLARTLASVVLAAAQLVRVPVGGRSDAPRPARGVPAALRPRRARPAVGLRPMDLGARAVLRDERSVDGRGGLRRGAGRRYAPPHRTRTALLFLF